MPNNCKKEMRKRICKIFFEKFEVERIIIANKAALAMYGSNRITGILLHIGGCFIYIIFVNFYIARTEVIPIINGIV